MTRKATDSRYEARRAETEDKLREALARLERRVPTHPELKGRAYRLNVSTLALEAGVSRNAIYDNHKWVLEDLRRAGERQEGMPERIVTANDKIAELKKHLRNRESEIRQLATQNASLLQRALDAEESLKVADARLYRLQSPTNRT